MAEDELSRSVLASLRTLNASLADVRRRIHSIDALTGGSSSPCAGGSAGSSAAPAATTTTAASNRRGSRAHSPPPAALTRAPAERSSAGSAGANAAWQRSAAASPDGHDAHSAGSRHSSRHSRVRFGAEDEGPAEEDDDRRSERSSVRFRLPGDEQEEEEEGRLRAGGATTSSRGGSGRGVAAGDPRGRGLQGRRRSGGSVRFAGARGEDDDAEGGSAHTANDDGSNISSDAPGGLGSDDMAGLDHDLAELLLQQQQQQQQQPAMGAKERHAHAARLRHAPPHTPLPPVGVDTALARWEAFQAAQPPSGASPAAAAAAVVSHHAAPAPAAVEGGPGSAGGRVFRFQRYHPCPPALLQDDGSGEDIPLHVSFISDDEFAALLQAPPATSRGGPDRDARRSGLRGARAAGAESARSHEEHDAYALTGADAADPLADDPDGVAARIAAWRGGDTLWHTPGAGSTSAAAAAAAASSSSSAAAVAAPPRFEALSLRIVYQAGRTGFAESKDLKLAPGSTIAGRYVVREFLGSAAFSTAVSAADLATGEDVCLKVIKNKKEFFDQSLDEIKLLRYLNACSATKSILQLIDYFYVAEHLVIVTELLKDNLFEFQRYLAVHEQPPYFTPPRLQSIARQVLQALALVHGKGIIHSDLKPENLLIRSYSRCEVTLIDFGSSCFITDAPTSYIQSRSYRAPEVILGLPYSPKIDVWSLGTILAELACGRVLFANDSIQTMLARMTSLLGPFPPALARARDAPKFLTPDGSVYERLPTGGSGEREAAVLAELAGAPLPAQGGVALLRPLRTDLQLRLGGACGGEDPGILFLEFLAALLALDPSQRPTAAQALLHPWLAGGQSLPVAPYVLPAACAAGGVDADAS